MLKLKRIERRGLEQSCEVHINIQEIPDFRRVKLAEGALDLVALAFAAPDAESRYQAWLAERRGCTPA